MVWSDAYGAAVQPLPANLGYFTVLLSVGNGFSLLILSATGGLVADTVPPELYGRAAGWLQAGNLGGAAVFGAIGLRLSETLSLGWVGLIAASMVMLVALPALTINESERPKDFREQFKSVAEELWAARISRETRRGLAIFTSPLGACAAVTLFTAVAADYHVSARLIASLTGMQGLVIACGAVVGGSVCDRIDRRMANVAGALLSAAATIPLLLGSYSAMTFALGMSFYAFAAGF